MLINAKVNLDEFTNLASIKTGVVFSIGHQFYMRIPNHAVTLNTQAIALNCDLNVHTWHPAYMCINVTLYPNATLHLNTD